MTDKVVGKLALILSVEDSDVTKSVISYLKERGYIVTVGDPLIFDSRGWKVNDYSLVVIEGPGFFSRLAGMVHVVRSLNPKAEIVVLTDQEWPDNLRDILRQDRVWLSCGLDGLKPEKIRLMLDWVGKDYEAMRPFGVR